MNVQLNYLSTYTAKKCNVLAATATTSSREHRWKHYLTAWRYMMGEAQLANANDIGRFLDHLLVRGHKHTHLRAGIATNHIKLEYTWHCGLASESTAIFRSMKPSWTTSRVNSVSKCNFRISPKTPLLKNDRKKQYLSNTELLLRADAGGPTRGFNHF
jgi:hypothetical protein